MKYFLLAAMCAGCADVRGSRGRSAPNWNLFEQCMRARGYERR